MRVAVASMLLLSACGGTTRGTSGSPFPASGGAGDGGHLVIFGAGGAPSSLDAGSAGGAREIVDGGSCQQAFDFLNLDVAPRTGATFPGIGETTDLTFDGAVTDVADDHFVVDQCSTHANCSAPYTVTLSGPGLVAREQIPRGALVHLHFHESCPWGCERSLFVGSLATWAGLTNPEPAPLDFYFSGDDGGGKLSDTPYDWTTPQLACAVPAPPGVCGDPAAVGLYAFEFTMKADSTTALVTMGTPVSLIPQGVLVQFHDVRSFVTGACDDYWNFAHWARPLAPTR